MTEYVTSKRLHTPIAVRADVGHGDPVGSPWLSP